MVQYEHFGESKESGTNQVFYFILFFLSISFLFKIVHQRIDIVTDMTTNVSRQVV